jgi:Uma2 family endonuclease
MAIAQLMTEEAYEEFVLSGVDGLWELHDGRLAEKPGMSWDHLEIAALLNHLLRQQLDRSQYRVFSDSRVRRPTATVFLPDVAVVPTAYGQDFIDRPGTLAVFSLPLPLVVEIWSASTGGYDVTAKPPIYQQRGDREIWLIHPYERTLTSWVRDADGSYRETVYHEGTVTPVALPGVSIPLAVLFAP